MRDSDDNSNSKGKLSMRKKKAAKNDALPRGGTTRKTTNSISSRAASKSSCRRKSENPDKPKEPMRTVSVGRKKQKLSSSARSVSKSARRRNKPGSTKQSKDKKEKDKKSSIRGPVKLDMSERTRQRRVKVNRAELRKRLDAVKNVQVHIKNVDEEDVGMFVQKIKTMKKNPTQTQEDILDKKTLLTLDRVSKKTKAHVDKELTKALDEEDRKKRRDYSVHTMMPVAPTVYDESYDKYPKLEEVLKLPGDVSFLNPITRLPTWCDNPEPCEADLQGMEMAIAVGSEHIELFHEKKIKLVNAECCNLTLDVFQPFPDLQARDGIFTDQVICSNTIRSLINITKPIPKQENAPSFTIDPITFKNEKPIQVSYNRDDPIATMKAEKIEKNIVNSVISALELKSCIGENF